MNSVLVGPSCAAPSPVASIDCCWAVAGAGTAQPGGWLLACFFCPMFLPCPVCAHTVGRALQVVMVVVCMCESVVGQSQCGSPGLILASSLLWNQGLVPATAGHPVQDYPMCTLLRGACTALPGQFISLCFRRGHKATVQANKPGSN